MALVFLALGTEQLPFAHNALNPPVYFPDCLFSTAWIFFTSDDNFSSLYMAQLVSNFLTNQVSSNIMSLAVRASAEMGSKPTVIIMVSSIANTRELTFRFCTIFLLVFRIFYSLI